MVRWGLRNSFLWCYIGGSCSFPTYFKFQMKNSVLRVPCLVLVLFGRSQLEAFLGGRWMRFLKGNIETAGDHTSHLTPHPLLRFQPQSEASISKTGNLWRMNYTRDRLVEIINQKKIQKKALVNGWACEKKLLFPFELPGIQFLPSTLRLAPLLGGAAKGKAN